MFSFRSGFSLLKYVTNPLFAKLENTVIQDERISAPFKTTCFKTILTSSWHRPSHNAVQDAEYFPQRSNILSTSKIAVLSRSVDTSIVINQIRTVIKWSWYHGKRKTDMDVIKRFKRLDWGIWIRPIAGSQRQLWRKKAKRINRIQQTVFCNATQSRRLDRMVTNYWKKIRVYPDDPYRPYLKRENFPFSQMKARDDFF